MPAMTHSSFANNRLSIDLPPSVIRSSHCRSCGAELRQEIIDFGAMPISNALLRPEDVASGEKFYPLRVMACEACHLVQLAEDLPADTHFHSDYAYFSSFSNSWLAHCEAFVDQAIQRFSLQEGDVVAEVASNDGYLLNFFKKRGMQVLGVEPSANVANAARQKGIPTETAFFGLQTAERLAAGGLKPKLIVANNVFAHVPDLNDFAAGFARLMHGESVLTVEVHYFLSLIKNSQFDSFYHEHYSYYTIRAAVELFNRHGLRVYDVDFLPTHGGSIRLYICRETASFLRSQQLSDTLSREDTDFSTAILEAAAFRDRIDRIGDDLRRFLIEARRSGRKVAGFGAPAKATTLLNHARITRHLLPFTVDSNPAKQELLIPGVHVPVFAPTILDSERPDFVLVLPWNLREELLRLFAARRENGTKIVFAVPELEIV
ncbi:methyltransferase domain-containing protein [Bradyrhizobium sp. KB893862 SZCCT0404]|uniref:class I SAM-dependent methyltransferase n=1 Tax=Bradyrhizobium sp. KB893862 SZCCT0404 TaxID=2807672 RepID=UPI001BAD6CAA|nr:class I SAM-dependent methyltransferase [Bradyrhizobium sp. KB893862 SZCCT0404]MBR1174206.1 methyltransferase domain-containing protein [Bradyrhizobium sp. KB893862 SZCCT0404]